MTSRWLRSRSAASHGLSQSAQTWDAQYAAGSWDFLGRLAELPRYSVLAGYVRQLGRRGSVLDIGCGQGLLLRQLCGGSYSRYVGIDLAASAIDAARAMSIEHSDFSVADCDSYSPVGEFDVVVFNEVLYYLRDPLGVTARYARALTPNGILLVSVCTAARGGARILQQLGQHYTTLSKALVRDGGSGVSWSCAVFADPRKA